MKRFIASLALLVLVVSIATAAGNGEGQGNNGSSENSTVARGQGNGAGRGGKGSGYGSGNREVDTDRSPELYADMILEIEMSDLSEAESAGLAFMYEEEKLARDVYAALYEIWNYPVFTNISSSEQQHMDAIGVLIDRYGLSPQAATEPGVFTSDKLQSLYNDLVEQGRQSLVEALTVGATVEDLDIADLLEYIDQTDNDDIAIVYQNLLKGSRNHLRAFSSQLERQDVIYSAVFIDESYLEKILATEREAEIITDPAHTL